jgi:hypothetical protein
MPPSIGWRSLANAGRRFCVIAFLAIAVLVTFSTVAHADNTSADWGYFPLTGGSCGGLTHAGAVAGAQGALQGNGEYSSYAVDGVYGQGTYNAAAHFQATHGLSEDGCVGRNTWRALKDPNRLVCGGGHPNCFFTRRGYPDSFDRSNYGGGCIWTFFAPSGYSIRVGGSVRYNSYYRMINGFHTRNPQRSGAPACSGY